MTVRVVLNGTIAIAVVCASMAGAQAVLPAELAAMVETEREFARTARIKGVRDAFLEFFSDDSLAFAPAPVPAKERIRGRAAQPPSVQELTWEPRTGDVAASGDLGWLTGPATLVNRAGPKPVTRYSNYLSIWRKEPDGRWRVFIDFGISVPEPARYEPGFTRFPFGDRYRGQQSTADAAKGLLAADRDLNEGIASNGAVDGYRTRLTNASRLNRDGFVPVVGPSAIGAWFAQHTPRLTARSGSSGASGAGDLGYTYGTYETAGEKPEAGAYVRIWTRTGSGRWIVVADVTQGKR